jgi:bla regulator protein BlaR1
MGARMNEERERASDEKVIAHNARPEVYAKSILEVCEFCVTTPLPCISGVSGGDLKQRIRRIMTHGSSTALSTWRKAALAAAAVLTLAVPLVFGATHGQTPAASTPESGQSPTASADLPKYDIASIKPYKADDGPAMRVMLRITPDGVSLHGVPLRMIVQESFGVEQDRILNQPAWIGSARYNIEAKVEPEDAPKLKDLKMEQRNAMMLQLLVDRFHLKYHHEKRELPMYALVVAKGGLKMKPSKPDENPPQADAPKPGDAPGRVAFGPPPAPGTSKPGDGPPPRMGKGMFMMNPGHLESTGTPIDMLAHVLSRQLGRTVVDKTGLTGNYDFTLDYTPDNMPMPVHGGPEGGPKPEMQPDAGGPSLFTAVQEQLGLKLESTKATVDVIVIDHIDQPSEN